MERLKQMNLKKSFFYLTLFFLLIAIVLSIIVILGFNFINMSTAMTRVSISINDNAKISGVKTLQNYSMGWSTVLSVLQIVLPVVFITSSLLVADIIFYRIKLRQPLMILKEGAERIIQNDLDFTIYQPSEDEMGRLCATFESMRSELLKSNQELWKQSEERKRLNAAFSHDLRNPVTVLKGSINVLLKGLKSGKFTRDNIHETLDLMSEYTRRIEVYIDAMSSAQILEELQCVLKETEWNVFTREFCNSVNMLTNDICIETLINFDKCSKTVWIDKSIVLNIVENLIVNAFRFTKTKIEINLTLQDNQMILAIQDDGKGFPQKILKKGIAPFFRGEEEDNSKHLGMGLYICSLMCEKHGGTIELKNNDIGALAIIKLKTCKF